MKENKKILEIFNLLLIRISLISLYISFYKNIEFISEDISRYDHFIILLFQILTKIEKLNMLKYSYFKAFSIIFLLVMILLPIISTLTCEISTDTIFFYFFICQLIYCVDSVKSSILDNSRINFLKFERNYTILLEESLLIFQNNNSNGTISKISAVIGFILLFSRLENLSHVTFFQLISFILYFFIPKFLERLKIHHYLIKMILIFIITVLILFLIDINILYIYLSLVSLIFLSFILIIEYF